MYKVSSQHAENEANTLENLNILYMGWTGAQLLGCRVAQLGHVHKKHRSFFLNPRQIRVVHTISKRSQLELLQGWLESFLDCEVNKF